MAQTAKTFPRVSFSSPLINNLIRYVLMTLLALLLFRVILREMTHNPRLIIASYLTRGLDVQSTIAARQALIQAREGGAGVLLISEDLEELLTLSDRLLVMYGGRIVGEFKPSETNVYEIGHLMTGSKVEHGTNG